MTILGSAPLAPGANLGPVVTIGSGSQSVPNGGSTNVGPFTLPSVNWVPGVFVFPNNTGDGRTWTPGPDVVGGVDLTWYMLNVTEVDPTTQFHVKLVNSSAGSLTCIYLVLAFKLPTVAP